MEEERAFTTRLTKRKLAARIPALWTVNGMIGRNGEGVPQPVATALVFGCALRRRRNYMVGRHVGTASLRIVLATCVIAQSTASGTTGKTGLHAATHVGRAAKGVCARLPFRLTMVDSPALEILSNRGRAPMGPAQFTVLGETGIIGAPVQHPATKECTRALVLSAQSQCMAVRLAAGMQQRPRNAKT